MLVHVVHISVPVCEVDDEVRVRVEDLFLEMIHKEISHERNNCGSHWYTITQLVDHAIEFANVRKKAHLRQTHDGTVQVFYERRA